MKNNTNVLPFPSLAERIMQEIRKGPRIDQLDLYAILTNNNPIGPDDHEYIWPTNKRRQELLNKYGLLVLVENAEHFARVVQKTLKEHPS